MKKRVLSLFLVVLLVAAILSPQAFAASKLQGDTNKNGTVDVFLSISEGTQNFYETKTGKRIVQEQLHVPYFDLALYGLEHYYYNPDCYTGSTQQAGTKLTADGVVTTMHVFIYATEVFMCDIDPEDAGTGIGSKVISEYISWGQGAGSSFMTFWNGSTNLNYYLDYKFPLGREGWGSTSDQQALEDGSGIEIHLIQDEGVMGSQYAFLANEEGKWDFGTVKEGEELPLTLYRTLSASYGEPTNKTPIPDTGVYYILAEEYGGELVSQWNHIGDTDENGCITIPGTLEAGTYYVSAPGDVLGSSERGPAAYVLEVKSAKGVDLYGDADMDGYVTSKDATLVLQKAAETDVEIDSAAADVDGDGYVTSKDAAYILQYAAEIFTKFPIESNG